MRMKGVRVLVTGASGFIGSHLVKRLLSEGAKVSVLTRDRTFTHNIRLASVWKQLHSIEADLRDPDALRRIREVEPEIIYHLAAYNHVGDSFMHVSEVFDVNTKGTANLMECYDGYDRFIYISTSEVYGLQSSIPFREDMNPQPISPYAVSKYSGELFCRMKHHVTGAPVVVLRPFNAYGPYQSSKAIIPELILGCLRGETIKTTKGEQTREFNFVEDLIDGFILAGKTKSVMGEIINLGSGREIAIKDLALKVVEFLKSDVRVEIGAIPYRPIEIWRMYSDNTKSEKILGWKSKTTLEDGLVKTIDWYRSYYNLVESPGSSFSLL